MPHLSLCSQRPCHIAGIIPSLWFLRRLRDMQKSPCSIADHHVQGSPTTVARSSKPHPCRPYADHTGHFVHVPCGPHGPELSVRLKLLPEPGTWQRLSEDRGMSGQLWEGLVLEAYWQRRGRNLAGGPSGRPQHASGHSRPITPQGRRGLAWGRGTRRPVCRSPQSCPWSGAGLRQLQPQGRGAESPRQAAPCSCRPLPRLGGGHR